MNSAPSLLYYLQIMVIFILIFYISNGSMCVFHPLTNYCDAILGGILYLLRSRNAENGSKPVALDQVVSAGTITSAVLYLPDCRGLTGN